MSASLSHPESPAKAGHVHSHVAPSPDPSGAQPATPTSPSATDPPQSNKFIGKQVRAIYSYKARNLRALRQQAASTPPPSFSPLLASWLRQELPLFCCLTLYFDLLLTALMVFVLN